MKFLQPMLALATEENYQLGDERYIAEPKIDGYRGQIHIDNFKTAAVYTRKGRDFKSVRGLKWLCEVTWPVKLGIVDCELYGGQGVNLDGPLVAHHAASGHLNAGLFDVLSLNGESMLAIPWKARRQCLEVIFKNFSIIPYATDHKLMWSEWVEKSQGEGIILKRTASLYHPGSRGSEWLKVKVEKDVDVVLTSLTNKPSYTKHYKSGSGWAYEFGFWNAKTKQFDLIGQGAWPGTRGTKEEMQKQIGRVVELRCNGINEEGGLRNHRFRRWRPDKSPKECLRP